MARTVPNVPFEQVPDPPLGSRMLVVVLALFPFGATLYALLLLWNDWVTWLELSLLLGLALISGLGMSLGYHRLLAHRSFETTPWLKRLLLICGCLACLGSPLRWAANHIQHHVHADAEYAPRQPLAALRYLYGYRPQASAVVYATWLNKDPLAVWVSKTWLIWAGLGLLGPLAIAGWSGLFWAGVVRIALSQHISWCIYALCHSFGRRSFPTREGSRNNVFVALFTFGEGWLNNHYAHPRAAIYSLHWWQIDGAGYLICLLERYGLAWNVVRRT